jgi:hypothetical protein
MTFKYNKFIILLAAVITPLAGFCIWLLITDNLTFWGTTLFIALSCYFCLLPATNIYRSFDRIIITSDSITQVGLLKEQSIKWEDAVGVRKYFSLFEEPGVRIVSKEGTSVIFTKNIVGFSLLISRIHQQIPHAIGRIMNGT